MKKLLSILIIVHLFFGCGEDTDFSGPAFEDALKTLGITLKNVPDSYIGETVYFFTMAKGVVVTTGEGEARDFNMAMLVPPEGEASFDVVAFIPTDSDWKLSDGIVDESSEESEEEEGPVARGYYSIITGITNRSISIVADSWDEADDVDAADGGGILSKIKVSLGEFGSEFEVGEIVKITSTVTNNSDGTITEVVYTLGETVLATYTEAPYDFDFNSINTAVGRYTLTVRATNSDGDVAEDDRSILFSTTQNEGPTVSIGYSNDFTINTGGLVTSTVTATDADGEITSVTLSLNGTALTLVDGSTYSFEWDPLDFTAGTITFEATATDNDGVTRTTSVNGTLEVPDNYLPRVSFDNISEGDVITRGDQLTISVTATDEGGTVETVTLTTGGFGKTLTDQTTYDFDWNTYDNSLTGTVTISVTATDNDGGSTTKNIDVTLEDPDNFEPFAKVTYPVGVTIAAGSFTITTTVDDLDLDVTGVTFFVDGANVGEDLTAPYSFFFDGSGLSVGDHTVHVTITDGVFTNNSKTETFTIQ